MEKVFKQQVSAKLNQTTLDRIHSTYTEVTGTDRPLTFREYFEYLYDRAMAAKTTKALHDEHNNIIDQKALNDIISVRDSLFNELTETKHELISLKTQLATQPTELKPTANQLLIDLTPLQRHLLDELATIESKRARKTITPGQILTTLFDHHTFYGPGDWLPKIYSKSQLNALKLKLELAQAHAEAEAQEQYLAENPPGPEPETEPEPESDEIPQP